MKKFLKVLMLLLVCMALLTACGECDHDWEKATCEDPKTCSKCGEEKGKPDEDAHEWEEDDDGVMVCEICGEEKEEGEGEDDEPVAECEHDWVAATCEEPAYCEICGVEGEDALGHSYNSHGTCTECGAQDPAVEVAPTGDGFECTWEEYADNVNAVLAELGVDMEIYYYTIDEDGDALFYVCDSDGYDYDSFLYLVFDDNDMMEEVMVFGDFDGNVEAYVTLCGACSMAADPSLDFSTCMSIFSMDPIYSDDTLAIIEYSHGDLYHNVYVDGSNSMYYYDIIWDYLY